MSLTYSLLSQFKAQLYMRGRPFANKSKCAKVNLDTLACYYCSMDPSFVLMYHVNRCIVGVGSYADFFL